MSGAELYRAMVAYVEANGWQRTAPHEGWWWKTDTDMSLGEAVDTQLRDDHIDTRYPPQWLPDFEEYLAKRGYRLPAGPRESDAAD